MEIGPKGLKISYLALVPVFTESANVRKRAKKPYVFFGCVFLVKIFFFHFFEAKTPFKGEKNSKHSRHFDNFSAYDISGTVAPISMILFANCCKFYSISMSKKNRFLAIINFKKSSKM